MQTDNISAIPLSKDENNHVLSANSSTLGIQQQLMVQDFDTFK